MNTLYIFAGLPGTGKSELSQNLARERRAVYLRIDTIEQALRDSRTFIAEEKDMRSRIGSLQTIFVWASMSRRTP